MMPTYYLTIITVAWAISLAVQGIPLLFFPIARQKRAQVIGISVISSLAVIFAWIGRSQLHSVSGYSLLAACLTCSVAYLILRKLDYYVDEILREIVLIIGAAASISAMTSLWYWGIEQNPSLIGIRVAVALIPLVIMGIVGLILREQSIIWMIILFVVILVIKTLVMPWWLIWTPIMVLLFAIMGGYIVYWQLTTTNAEKVFSWNIDPAKVWLILAVLVGLLVLAF